MVKGIIAELERLGSYMPETREDAAVGLVTGAYLCLVYLVGLVYFVFSFVSSRWLESWDASQLGGSLAS